MLVASKSERFNMRWDSVIGTVTRLGGSNPVRGKKFPLLQSVQPPIQRYCGRFQGRGLKDREVRLTTACKAKVRNA